MQVFQVRKDAGIGEQGLHLHNTLIATGKHQLRGHARTLNANAGRKRGSERGSRDEVANVDTKRLVRSSLERGRRPGTMHFKK